MRKDYQGNNRVVVDQDGVTEQITHYFPYGGTFGEGIFSPSELNNYLESERIIYVLM